MCKALTENPSAYITVEGDSITTTSLLVADAFNKNHKDILRKLNSLDCSPEFNERNFAPVEYTDAKGEQRTSYEMTKDGFIFLVMGFTGKKAAQIKEAYITAFNQMAQQLFEQYQAAPQLEYRPLTPAHQLKLRRAVEKRAKANGTSYSTIYHALHDTFEVPSYKDIQDHQFSEAMAMVKSIVIERPPQQQPIFPAMPNLSRKDESRIDVWEVKGNLNQLQGALEAINATQAANICQDARTMLTRLWTMCDEANISVKGAIANLERAKACLDKEKMTKVDRA